MFPYAATVSRRLDMDHTIAYLSPASGGPPGKPESATSDPTSAATTTTKPMAAGKYASQYQAFGCGDHPTGASTSSTPPAPIPSAIPGTPKKMWRAARPPQQQLDKLALPSAD